MFPGLVYEKLQNLLKTISDEEDREQISKLCLLVERIVENILSVVSSLVHILNQLRIIYEKIQKANKIYNDLIDAFNEENHKEISKRNYKQCMVYLEDFIHEFNLFVCDYKLFNNNNILVNLNFA